MQTVAVVLQKPEHLVLGEVGLIQAAETDAVVEVLWSGVSTGTEKLLWSGRMPAFPGLSYPLVPGYESVGIVRDAGSASGLTIGQHVFVPGSRGFRGVAGLFGGASHFLVAAGQRLVPIDPALGEDAALIALAATAHHAVAGGAPPDLVIGHGVLGRLIARMAIALDHPAPTVWENNPQRRSGAAGYAVTDSIADICCDYRSIIDVSGDASLLDTLILRLAKGGEIALAGFYDVPVAFTFPPAFMREMRLRVAAEFLPADIAAVLALIADGRLSLSGLITHRAPASDAAAAYRTAFTDPACLKMILDWRDMP
ncbi:MAG: chlorophyll synthesis pathway protein BchC [Beijerinckiaceae bacterium]